MLHWFQLGGVAMWVTLAVGCFSIVSASRYARHPNPRYVPLVMCLGVLTLLSGGFGFTTGLIASLQGKHVLSPDQRWLWMIGLSESLVNVAFALLLVSLTTAAMVVGAYRLARPTLAPSAP